MYISLYNCESAFAPSGICIALLLDIPWALNVDMLLLGDFATAQSSMISPRLPSSQLCSGHPAALKVRLPLRFVRFVSSSISAVRQDRCPVFHSRKCLLLHGTLPWFFLQPSSLLIFLLHALAAVLYLISSMIALQSPLEQSLQILFWMLLLLLLLQFDDVSNEKWWIIKMKLIEICILYSDTRKILMKWWKSCLSGDKTWKIYFKMIDQYHASTVNPITCVSMNKLYIRNGWRLEDKSQPQFEDNEPKMAK